MPAIFLDTVRAALLTTSIPLVALGMVFPAAQSLAQVAVASPPALGHDVSIRPFRFRASDADLADLKRRIAATRWPDRELVTDDTQGVRLATMQKLAEYWANQYDWRPVEARLNALPQFVTDIDGVGIHFIHVKSKHPNALPVIVTHGWPGSVIEQLKIIGPLTDPTAHGGEASDAFDVIIPSLPGYGFSGKPRELGWDPQRIARAWATLMTRLGYERYVAQGGDWGDAVNEQMALQEPKGLLGIHTNMPGTLPDSVDSVQDSFSSVELCAARPPVNATMAALTAMALPSGSTLNGSKLSKSELSLRPDSWRAHSTLKRVPESEGLVPMSLA